MKNTELKNDEAMLAPEAVFTDPSELVKYPALSVDKKLAALERWRESILGRLAAASEGMPTNGMATVDTELLARVDEATAELQSKNSGGR